MKFKHGPNHVRLFEALTKRSWNNSGIYFSDAHSLVNKLSKNVQYPMLCMKIYILKKCIIFVSNRVKYQLYVFF